MPSSFSLPTIKARSKRKCAPWRRSRSAYRGVFAGCFFLASLAAGAALYADVAYRLPERCERRPEGNIVRIQGQLESEMSRVLVGDLQQLVGVFCSSVPEVPSLERDFFGHEAVAALPEIGRMRLFEYVARRYPETVLRLYREDAVAVPLQAMGMAIALEEERFSRRAMQMNRRDQLEAYMGEAARRGVRAGGRAERPGPWVDNLEEDPAIAANFDAIEDAWLQGVAGRFLGQGLLYSSFVEYVQVKIMIARNLFFADREVTRDAVSREYERILRARARLEAVPLFSQRQVVYMASKQKDGRKRYVFGSERSQKALEREEGAEVSFLREGKVPASVAISEVEDARRLTLIFEGHGRRGGWVFGGELSARRMSKALVRRNDGGEPAIVIGATCFGHNFVRRMLADISGSADARLPIVIVPEEYGQVFVKTSEERFLDRGLGIGSSDSATLGSVWRSADARVTVYVPDENNVPMQIL